MQKRSHIGELECLFLGHLAGVIFIFLLLGIHAHTVDLKVC